MGTKWRRVRLRLRANIVGVANSIRLGRHEIIPYRLGCRVLVRLNRLAPG
jgi:hypothetical protein